MLSDTQKINLVLDYLGGATARSLDKKYGLSSGSAYGLIKRRGIETRPAIYKSKYSFNKDIFNAIDNEEKSYWLGFLLGDGCVTKNSLRLELSSIDINHIQKFKKFISSDNPIANTTKNCSFFSVNSRDFVNTIASLGLVPNKTYHETLTPKQIPSNLLVHFYRGILDADGWLCEHKSTKGKSQYEFGFSSYCIKFLEEIKTWINNKTGKDLGYLKERFRANNTQRVCQLIIGGRGNFKLLHNLFYHDATVYLDRKKEKADRFLSIINNNVDGRTTRFS